jgi:hypothetical protein
VYYVWSHDCPVPCVGSRGTIIVPLGWIQCQYAAAGAMQLLQEQLPAGHHPRGLVQHQRYGADVSRSAFTVMPDEQVAE